MTPWADIGEVVKRARAALKPPPKLTLSEWAERFFYLSDESAAQPGRWHAIPYQRGILDAITDPNVERVYVKKSARVGYTKCMNAAIGFHMQHDPCSMLVVQPTMDGAKKYSKEEIAPMLRDCPALTPLVFENEEEEDGGPKGGGNTILHKRFPGGVLSLIGANSGAGFRSISRRVVIFDEVDAYPPSAGSDGDPVKLGIKRSEFYWNRKIVAGSTPLIAGRSRIDSLFLEGDQRRYFVPCPHCGHMAPLVFKGDGGHAMTWPEGKPEDAFFTCQQNGCVIEHKDKRGMVERGEWRAAAPFNGVASFHIWTAYSYAPKATWADLAREFLEAKDSPDQLRTYVNTALGETWEERGDAPDYQRLYNRRESYQIGSVPAGVSFLTSGVDVQKDRWVYEVVGWDERKRSWSVDAGVIMGDTSNEAEWSKLDELLARTYPATNGVALAIRMLAVDSGYNTNTVYNWARRHSMARVIAIKGQKTTRALLETPSPVDITVGGKRLARGYKVWPVGTHIAKTELYGWLRLPDPESAGYCHFPEYGEGYFKELTSEQIVEIVNERTREKTYEWRVLAGRENHQLDCRVYARAAAARLGLDRVRVPKAAAPEPAAVTAVVPAPEPKKEKRSDFRFGGVRGKRESFWKKR